MTPRAIGCTRPPRQASLSLVALLLTAVLVPVVAGACKKEHKANPADDCEAVLAGALAAVEGADRAAHANARNGGGGPQCAADGDCVESPAPKCLPGCGGYAVAKSESSSFAAVIQRVNDDHCRRWDEGGCERLVPRTMPSCPLNKPRCKDSSCSMVDSRNLVRGDCEERYANTDRQVRAALEHADKRCKRPADCAPSSVCGEVVAVAGAPALSAALKGIDDEAEGWFVARCREVYPRASPSCPSFVPTCTKGQCTNPQPPNPH